MLGRHLWYLPNITHILKCDTFQYMCIWQFLIQFLADCYHCPLSFVAACIEFMYQDIFSFAFRSDWHESQKLIHKNVIIICRVFFFMICKYLQKIIPTKIFSAKIYSTGKIIHANIASTLLFANCLKHPFCSKRKPLKWGTKHSY